MGTTSKPLLILVIGVSSANLVFERLTAQGHVLVFVSDEVAGQAIQWEAWDLIIGPKCWRTLPDLKYLEVSIKQARKERYS